MESKIKAGLITFFILLFSALVVYGFTREVQFIGILLASSLILFITVGLYNSILSYLENKSKNNKNKKQ
jgi:hypothetical protein